MRNYFCLAFVVTLLMFGCDKESGSSGGCHTTAANSPDNHQVADATMDTVRSLFDANDMALDDFQVYDFRYNEVNNRYNVYTYQFYNGKKIHGHRVYFMFNKEDEQLDGTTNEKVEGIGLDSKFTSSSGKVYATYKEALENDESFPDELRQRVLGACLELESGYMDANAFASDTSKQFVKAWEVKTENNGSPLAYIEDGSLEMIGQAAGSAN